MKHIAIILLLAFVLIWPVIFAGAQEGLQVPNGTVVDSDLDGLTDEGEVQAYQTNPKDPDTDKDGYFDGAEVLGGTNPLDPNSPSLEEPLVGEEVQEETTINEAPLTEVEREVPWAWYATRLTGIVAFVLLFLSMLAGLTIRIPFLNRTMRPIMASNFHCWISLQALIFALAHGLALLFDKFYKFSLLDIFIPFSFRTIPGQIDTNFIAMGIVGFYIMTLLVVTSYLKRHISHNAWRAVHFANIALYFLVVTHILFLGTDFKEGVYRNAFVVANVALIVLMLYNMLYRIIKSIRLKNLHKAQ